jgi:hypothetical protein
VFQDLSTDAVRKRNVAAFLLAFDTGIAPAVGHARTMTGGNVTSTTVTNEWSVLEQQAAAAKIDVIVKGTLDAQHRGSIVQARTTTARTGQVSVRSHGPNSWKKLSAATR